MSALQKLRELNAALRMAVTGSSYKRIAPRQMWGRHTLAGRAASAQMDPDYFGNDGLWPLRITNVDAQRTGGSTLPSSNDDVIQIQVRDRRTGFALIGNGNFLLINRLRDQSSTSDNGNDVGGRNSVLGFIPGGSYEIPKEGGFEVQLSTEDTVNDDGTGSSDQVDVLLYGYHVLEEF